MSRGFARRFTIAGAALLLAGGGMAPGRSRVALPAAYQVLEHKSIFARNRAAFLGRRAAASAPAAATRPDIPVFIGALHWGHMFTALLEWPASGIVRALRVHDIVPGAYGGRITRVTLRALAIVGPGQPPRRVHLGANLKEATPIMPAATTPGESGTSRDRARSEIMRRRQPKLK